MVTITQALTTVIWYGTGTTFSSANTPWATKTLIVRQVNGSGYSSFDPNPAQASFNTLQSVATGTVLIVESLASAYSVAGGYQLDNGTAPTATNTSELYATLPGGSNALSVDLILSTGGQVGTYVLNSALPATGFTSVSYKKNGLAITLSTTVSVALALGDALTVTGTTPAGTTGKLYLIKQ